MQYKSEDNGSKENGKKAFARKKLTAVEKAERAAKKAAKAASTSAWLVHAGRPTSAGQLIATAGGAATLKLTVQVSV